MAFPAIQPLESLVPGKHNHVSFLLPREEVESGLEFLGLLVMENRLKPETKPVLRELAAARIKSIMVTGESPAAMADGSSSLLQQPHDGGLREPTSVVPLAGDNLQTAVTVARNAHMIHEDSKVIIVEASEPEGSAPASIAWRLAEGSKTSAAAPNVSTAKGRLLGARVN